MIFESSYSQILKSSSIMGGAAAIKMLLGMLHIKFAAVFIGTIGVGILVSYNAMLAVIITLAGMGLALSAMRDIALASSQNDLHRMAHMSLALRRLCLLLGLVGAVIVVLISRWLSQLIFENHDHSVSISLLGLVVLLNTLNSGYASVIQGTRRIGDLASANIFGSAAGTFLALVFYFWLGVQGVVPALLAVAATQFLATFFYAHRIYMPTIEQSWRRCVLESRSMVKLGLTFMLSALLATTSSLVIIAMITRKAGLETVGLYSAAFALSGVFVGFVLNAMSADYYPRLTAVITDKVQVVRLVNEQTEIGLLLATPGLLATFLLAPWIIKIFYTIQFAGAVPLLQWFVLGCLGRVISWPLSYVIMALGRGKLYLATELVASALHVLLVFLSLNYFTLDAVAQAFIILYIIYTFMVVVVVGSLIEFKWSKNSLKIIFSSCMIFALAILIGEIFSGIFELLIGLIFIFIVGVFCMRAILDRLGESHVLFRKIRGLPVVGRILAA